MATSKLKEISVFFPCYNEQENIPRLVIGALEFLPLIADDYQIILVNDGSTDQTQKAAQCYVKANQHVELVSHETNRGYGAALRTGFLSAKKELVFYTDGDNQFDIKELSSLIELKDKYDIVSGYRLRRQDSFTRKLNAALYNFALFILFGLRIRDVDCAFKLYKRELFDRIEIISNGALVDAEILIKAKRLGYKIGQCGVSHFPRAAGKQTGANIKVILRAFKEIIKLRSKI